MAFSWQRDASALEAAPEELARRVDQMRTLLEQKERHETAFLNDLSDEEQSALLLCFLRAKGYDPAKSVARLLQYARFVRRDAGWIPGSASAACAATLQEELRSGVHMLLPQHDRLGHVVLSYSMAEIDLSAIASRAGPSIESYQRAGFYLLHRALQRPGAQTKGLAIVIDFGGFSFGSLLRHIRMSDLRRGVAMLQDCAPAHLNMIYLVNQPRWLGRLVGMLTPFLKKRSLSQKFQLLGTDRQLLHAALAPEGLPTTLGGDLDYKWADQCALWEAEEALACGEGGAAWHEMRDRGAAGGAFDVARLPGRRPEAWIDAAAHSQAHSGDEGALGQCIVDATSDRASARLSVSTRESRSISGGSLSDWRAVCCCDDRYDGDCESGGKVASGWRCSMGHVEETKPTRHYL